MHGWESAYPSLLKQTKGHSTATHTGKSYALSLPNWIIVLSLTLPFGCISLIARVPAEISAASCPTLELKPEFIPTLSDRIPLV